MRDLLQKLEACWDCDGFLDHVRRGTFDPEEGAEFHSLLQSIELPEESLIPKRLLSLLWYLPSFLEWQKERVAEKGNGETYEKFVAHTLNILEEVLGVP